MRVNLPPKLQDTNSEVNYIECDRIVIIGANGSGKTRFGSQLHKLNQNNSFFIPAQRLLVIPESLSFTSLEQAEKDFFSGTVSQTSHGSRSSRDQHLPHKHLMDDYENLLRLLFVEEASVSIKYKKAKMNNQTDNNQAPETKLYTVQRIWESIITHKKLVLEELKVSLSEGYSGSEMSDGERYIFYIIGQVVFLKPNQIIIIDEPETHLYPGVVKKLYDQLESYREDCMFVYLTHDIDFAFTRQNTEKIWVKSYSGSGRWDYEILEPKEDIPEKLYLEILGVRNKVLFIEGNESSRDYKIFNQVFLDYTVKPLGSCERVIGVVNSFNQEKGFHNIESFGLIDRDRRSDAEINELNKKGIWVLDVAEIENVFLDLELVYEIAKFMGKKNLDEIIDQIKENLFNLFRDQLENQAYLHCKELFKKSLISISECSKSRPNELFDEMDNKYNSINKQKIFEDQKQEFTSLIDNKDYDGILKVFNFKNGLIPRLEICDLCGITNKPSPTEALVERVIALLKKNDETSNKIREIIKGRIKGNL